LFKINNPIIAATITVIINPYFITVCPVDILITSSACESAPSPLVIFLLIIVVLPLTYPSEFTTNSADVSATEPSSNPSGASISTILYLPWVLTSTKHVCPLDIGENV